MSEAYLYQQELKKQREQEKDSQFVKNIKKSKIIEESESVKDAEVTILSYFIVVLAIVADLLGLIPFAGNFLGLVFGILLAMLYFFNGLGKGSLKRRTRKTFRRWILRLVLYLIELLAIGFSWLPLFTIEALIDFSLSKRGFYKTVAKVEKITNKLKKLKKG